MSAGPPILAVVGPTASGKTALSIELAEAIGGEIISMDSRQVYRGMDIGTAKATAEQRAAVPHHGLDLVGPGERFSAGQFARNARRWIAEIADRGRTPILVGGTGFFLRALTHPIFKEPSLDSERRGQLGEYLESLDDDTLGRWLSVLDPAARARLARGGGRQRLVRALELPLLTGRPMTWWHAQSTAEAEPIVPITFVLNMPREDLDIAIGRRTEEMVRAGLAQEVAALLRMGYNERTPGMNATGYIEMIAYLRGQLTLKDAIATIQKDTRSYSKRQMTWFRTQLPEGAIWLDGTAPRGGLIRSIREVIGEPPIPERKGRSSAPNPHFPLERT